MSRRKLVGAQTPRICVIPDGVEHPKWQEVLEFVAALGVELDPWQWDVLRAALLRMPRDEPLTVKGVTYIDQWAAFAVAVCCPRQNGKNGILEIRELIGPLILGEKLLIHTAHLADTSKEGFRRLDDLIDANEWLSAQVRHIWRTNGHEAIEFNDGRRIRFRTRTRGGGRGFAGSPVVFDEAMFLPDVSMASAMPVISAQPDPQIWYMGSAVDQLTMDEGIVFSRVRERALNGDHERLVYFEWSLDYANPDEVPPDLDVQKVAAETNPAYGIRISPGYIAAEAREFGVGSRNLAVERYGVGDWPRTDRSASVIDSELWADLEDARSVMLDPAVLSFDVNPTRSRACIAAAGVRRDDLYHVEIIEHKRGTGWVADRLAELVETHDPLAVLCDSKGQAASLMSEVEEAIGIELTVIDTDELAQACGFIFDACDRRELRHLGTDELKAAIRGAAKRPLGDRWAWSRKNSNVDITPLVAVTLALWHVGNKLTSVYDERGMVAV